MARTRQSGAGKTARATPVLVLTSSGGYQWDSWLWRGVYFLGAICITFSQISPHRHTLWQILVIHMVQHLLLLVVMAPMLVAAAPLLPFWLGLPRWARRFVKSLKVGRIFYQIGRRLRQPAVSCVLLIAGNLGVALARP